MWDTCMPRECVVCLSSLFLLLEVDRENVCLLMSGSDDSVVRLKGFYCLVYVV